LTFCYDPLSLIIDYRQAVAISSQNKATSHLPLDDDDDEEEERNGNLNLRVRCHPAGCWLA
jgi:hypothetical protein